MHQTGVFVGNLSISVRLVRSHIVLSNDEALLRLCLFCPHLGCVCEHEIYAPRSVVSEIYPEDVEYVLQRSIETID